MLRHHTYSQGQKAQFNAWFHECVLSSNQADKTLQVDAYWDYQLWCIDNNQEPMPTETFGSFLRDTFPYSSVNIKGKRNDNLYHGLLLKDAGDWQTPLKGYDSSYQPIQLIA